MDSSVSGTRPDMGVFELIEAGSVGEVERFLQAGNDVNTRERGTNKTLLLKAIETQQKDIVKLLLDRGANPELHDQNGRSALVHAVLSGVRGMIQLLLQRIPDVNKPDKDGRSPLHYAVRCNWTQVADWFMFLGACATTPNNNGLSAKDMCSEEKMTKVLCQKVDSERPALRILAEHLEVKSAGDIEIQFGSDKDFTASTTFFLLKNYDPCEYEFSPKLKDDENFWGNVYESRVSEPNILLTVTFPLQERPDRFSEVFVKYGVHVKPEKESVAVVKCLEGLYEAVVEIRLGARGWFVLCCRPGSEELEVPDCGGIVSSTLDPNLQLDLPKKAFAAKGSLSIKIEESINLTKDLDAITSASSFYDIKHSSGQQPQEAIAVTLPLPADYTGKGELCVLSHSGPGSAEDEDNWVIIDVEKQADGQRVSFFTRTFSIKILTESPRGKPKKKLKRDVVELWPRRKIRNVNFLACAKPMTSKSHDVIVECCSFKRLETCVQKWEKKGYSLLRSSATFNSKSGTKYSLETQGNIKCLQDISRIKFTYYPGKFCYQSLELAVLKEHEIHSGSIAIIDLIEREREKDVVTYLSFVLDENAYVKQSGTVLKHAMNEITKGIDMVFVREELGQLTGKFIEAEVTQLVECQLDGFWKLWIYLDLPRTILDIELNSPRGCRQLLEKWFSTKRRAQDLGLTEIIKALIRMEQIYTAESLLYYLKRCSNSSECSKEYEGKPFWKWLTEQDFVLEKFQKSTPPEPMTDAFLVDILKHFSLDDRLIFIELGLSINEVDNVREGCKTAGPEYTLFMLFVKAREKQPDNPTFLEKVLGILSTRDMNDTKEELIKQTKEWMTTSGSKADPYRNVVEQFQ